MSTENRVDAQGAKTYKVNHDAIDQIDFYRWSSLFQLMGFTPNDCTDEGFSINGVDIEGDYYEVYFEDDKIIVVLDDDETEYKQDSAAFDLAITYGIYEEA